MSVKITKDRMAEVLASMQALTHSEVLVGIPEANAERREGGPMSNAQLGYLHEHGSPANNLPARPFLLPGVKAAKAKVSKALRQAALAALDGQKDKVEKALKGAGEVAARSVKAKLRDGPFAPLSPATIRGRKYSRDTKSMRASERRYLKLLAEGNTPEQAQDMASIKPLINTGQLRNAVTSVVRKKK